MLPEADSYPALFRDFRWQVPDRYNIGADVCDRWAAREPGRIALTFVAHDGPPRDYTYGDLRTWSNRLANLLRALGTERGDRVAVLLPQAPETAVGHIAIYKLGAIAVPLFALFGPEALQYRLANSGAKAVITNRDGAAKLAGIRAGLPGLQHVLCIDGEVPGCRDLAAALESQSVDFAPVDTAADDPALIIYTSGTTGQPKGALHGHCVLLGHLPGVEMSHDLLPQPGDKIWTPADWAWIGGLLDVLLPALHHGVPVVARRFEKFTGEAAFQLIQDFGIRNAFLPPTALKIMRAVPEPEKRWRLGMRSIASGGETLGAELIEWGRRVFGLTINEFYGQTECNMIVSSCARLMPARPGIMGRAAPGHHLAMVDSGGAVLPDGTLGNIAVWRPDPVMFLEYWRNPTATAAKFAGDWLLTGDTGVMDEAGWIKFVGRDDDVITSAGYRIGPGEIEDCLLGHPAVRLAAVVGKPDPERTEIVKAYVVLKEGHAPGAALVRDIQTHVKTRLAAHEYGRDVSIGDAATSLLRQSRERTDDYVRSIQLSPVPEAELRTQLSALKFGLELSAEQIRNASRILALPAGATFSVPGAGKTVEALANFFCRAQEKDRLLVIAPKNAFASWEENIADCMPNVGMFVRLRGGRDKIGRLLDDDPRFLLVTYQQLTRVADLIAAHCARHRVHVFLDESHRIKSGIARQTARAALSFAHLPVSKLIMSGTPMPQSVDDLLPQFSFLYPEIPATPQTVIDLIRPVYVRTNKRELGLPDVTKVVVPLAMAPMQHELYRLMKFEVAREAATALTIRSKQTFRALGRSVARLLQFVSNPALLSSDIAFAHPDLLAAVLAEGDGPKLKYVLRRARQLAREGQKVLIWSSFVRNVEYLAERLADIGAVYIHGGVDTGDEDDDETREGKIKLFHDDPNVRVLVANPAAASEGVSLHRVCHRAIYLDRTFNAAHYMQSEDRIHRFGLRRDQETIIEIVECPGTVDETVRERLGYKIGRMAEALEDSSLRPDPIPLDPTGIEDLEEYSTGLSQEDIQALLNDLKAGDR